MEKKLVSIIIPCYNEEEALAVVYPAIVEAMQPLEKYDFELLLVNDGSKDGTLAKMKALAEQDARVKYYSFSRNFGKEAAIYAGFSNAKGDYVVMMDADMQDPPALLPDMIAKLETGEYDCVATRRVTRTGEGAIRSFGARMFYKIIRRMTNINIADGARDYQMMTRQMVDSVLALTEYNRFSKGIFEWVGYRKTWLEFENVERAAGETKWSFWKLVLYSLEGIINFSSFPLTVSSYLGMFMTALSFVAIIFIVVRKLLFGDPVDGWASTVCIVTFVGGIQLFCMGIMGQYMAKMYSEVKNRPRYIIQETNGENVILNK
ncbi:MAG: glycosyltransferase family 2 protein [Roseburia sp.]|nr:glycosyltransferase family 2 protein [Roseburia sp.]